MQAQSEAIDVLLLTPVLRILGNLFARASAEEILSAFASDSRHLQCLVAAAQAPQHGLQKEALWALSNLAALHNKERWFSTVLYRAQGPLAVPGFNLIHRCCRPQLEGWLGMPSICTHVHIIGCKILLCDE